MRKIIKVVLIIAALSFVLVVAAMITMRLQDISNNTYKTYIDSYNDGILKGWIPEFIPLSSVNIRTHEDLDNTSQSWASIEFTAGDDKLIYANCKPLEKFGELEYLLCKDKSCAIVDAKNGRATFHLDSRKKSCLDEKAEF